MNLYKKPFLKWPGKKYVLLKHILPVLPKAQRLVEPFVGSGAVFLNADYQRFLIADSNSDLINLFKIIKKDRSYFICQLEKYFHKDNNKKHIYLQMRNRFNETKDIFERALLFVYLNKHGFNGLCRYNQSGYFNVPFGTHKNPVCSTEAIEHMHERLKKTKIYHGDFLNCFKQVKPGDVVYCDPPYLPLSKTAQFTAYSKSKFNEAEQIALAEVARKTANKGIPVIISNHDTPYARELYRDAKLIEFLAPRSISCTANNRKPVAEILAVFE